MRLTGAAFLRATRLLCGVEIVHVLPNGVEDAPFREPENISFMGLNSLAQIRLQHLQTVLPCFVSAFRSQRVSCNLSLGNAGVRIWSRSFIGEKCKVYPQSL